MKPLITPKDSGGAGIPATSLSSSSARLSAPNGTTLNTGVIPLPAGVRFVLIESLSADVFVKGGDNTVTVAAQTAVRIDWAGPDFVPASSSKAYNVENLTHLAVVSNGDVYLTVYS